MAKADYTYKIEDNILSIEDLNLGSISVTNDMDAVLKEIAKNENIDVTDYLIMYQDSEGVFDGIETENGKFTFFAISETDYEKAKHKLTMHNFNKVF